VADSSDVALAEFTALRAEIVALEQFDNATLAAALTVIAAVGSFALAKSGGRRELLLVLPIVLSGLGLVRVQWALSMDQIGKYIREHLWARLPGSRDDPYPSWEHFVAGSRRRLHGVVASVLILVVPSVVSLVITRGEWNTDLAPLWWGDIIVLVIFGVLALSVLRET
jgi:hypothetical protein